MKIKKECIGFKIHIGKKSIILDDVMTEQDFNFVKQNFPNYLEPKKKSKKKKVESDIEE